MFELALVYHSAERVNPWTLCVVLTVDYTHAPPHELPLRPCNQKLCMSLALGSRHVNSCCGSAILITSFPNPRHSALQVSLFCLLVLLRVLVCVCLQRRTILNGHEDDREAKSVPNKTLKKTIILLLNWPCSCLGCSVYAELISHF